MTTSAQRLAPPVRPAPTMGADRCKICEGARLRRDAAHAAVCGDCGAILRYPYLRDEELARQVQADPVATRAYFAEWYHRAAPRNHDNFTAMARFALADVDRAAALRVLDYGGGGGQFACVLRSLYPRAQVWMTDIADAAVLPEWADLSVQIPFARFPRDPQRFDAIFLNDVFEHVNDPVGVLRRLTRKLDAGGRIFIDTPRPSWLYPLLRASAPTLYHGLLRCTVSQYHLQLWTRRALAIAVGQAGLRIRRYQELAEFTCHADDYTAGIGATSSALRWAGRAFVRWAPVLRAHNKLMVTLERAH